MKTGSGNTQATEESLKRPIEESLVKKVDSKRSKTEELPSKIEILKKILLLMSQGKNGIELESEVIKTFPSSPIPELKNLTSEAVARNPDPTTLRDLDKNVLEKKAIEIHDNMGKNQEKNNLNPSVGNLNPESPQASPRQESAPANPNGVNNHTSRVEQERAVAALEAKEGAKVSR